MSRLLKRKRSDCSESAAKFAAIDSEAPYGVPIYTLLKDIEGNQQGDKPAHAKRRKKHKESILLSERYRAKTFFDLVGNDDANRRILRWLTYWKSCVFGTEPTLNEYTDELGRPLRKILLVNGPPGAGKTTAVHVIAKQAGFDVLEINASDERGAAIVKDRIHTAINSHQVSSRRPICVVADEVEGASEHGFVRSLVNLIKEDARALSSKAKKPTNGRKQASLLLRPIIAICNDVWASSLRSLRPLAEIVHFQRHSPNQLVQRLEQICDTEKIKLTTRHLLQMAENHDYDLRACLNALQFGADNGGDMDGHEKTDPSVLVKLLFLGTRPTSQQLEECTDIDRLVASCFTAYHEMNYIDDLLKKPVLISDFLALADNRRLPDEVKALIPRAFGHYFRSPGVSTSNAALSPGTRFGKPPSYYDELRQTRSVVDSMMKAASKEVKARSSHGIALLDLAPFALHISNPVVHHLLRPEDKEKLSLLAGCLHELGVDLRTEKLDNGAFTHKLEPPIELACIVSNAAQEEASMGSYIPRSQLKEALKGLKAKLSASALPAVRESQSQISELLGAKSISDIKEKVSDFFHPASSATASSKERVPQRPVASKVWVQYTEGFSNAVRTPVSWNELFGM